MHDRYLMPQIKKDLSKKMVFVGGPRQVGKTTLARKLLPKSGVGYLNWDIPDHRSQILKGELPNSGLWIFDELHKYRQWRNLLKGLYDGRPTGQQILVTGSARLDYYRYSGDSLQGRYHYLRLHPLSLSELAPTQETLMDLMELGGFPEPFFGGSQVEARRWSREYRSRLIQEDLSQLEQVKDLGTLELLAMRLPELVGSPLSINGLREDLKVAHKTASNWVTILERLYAIFRLSPLGSPKIRAVKKEQKHYQFDWTLVTEIGLRFENLVACHLLKWVHYRQDCFGEDYDLRYFRDIDGREVDFVVLKNRVPVWLVECKWNNAEVSPALLYLKAKFPMAEAYQISGIGTKDYVTPTGVRVCPALAFLSQLSLIDGQPF
ncbi:MAG: ATP-binding protein [Myxococcota bacterium]